MDSQEEEFVEPVYKEVTPVRQSMSNVLKSSDIKIMGDVKISVEEDSEDSVNIFLKKDAHDNIQEIKFICSCGKTKSLIMDYSE